MHDKPPYEITIIVRDDGATITGKTYPLSRVLREYQAKWDGNSKSWSYEGDFIKELGKALAQAEARVTWQDKRTQSPVDVASNTSAQALTSSVFFDWLEMGGGLDKFEQALTSFAWLVAYLGQARQAEASSPLALFGRLLEQLVAPQTVTQGSVLDSLQRALNGAADYYSLQCEALNSMRLSVTEEEVKSLIEERLAQLKDDVPVAAQARPTRLPAQTTRPQRPSKLVQPTTTTPEQEAIDR